MTNLRQKTILVLFIALVAVYVFQNELGNEEIVNPPVEPIQALDIENQVIVNDVKINIFETSVVISYSYDGELGKEAYILIEPLFVNPDEIVKHNFMYTASPIRIGKHEVEYNLRNPCNYLSECNASEFSVGENNRHSI